MRIPLSFAFLFSAACMGSSGGASDSPGAAPPPAAPGGDAAGGGVSFGGAQDIGELRSILDRGEIPGPDTFDANGFFNEHFNAPAPATCGNLLCVASGMSVGHDWLTGAHQATLQLAIESTVDPSTFHRLPMNLVVVVDHSGSMASDGRLDKVKGGLHTMIDQLHDEDRLAIVEFDDQVTVDATFGATLDRSKLHAIVDKLTPRGSTDIFDGLQQGFQLLGDVPASNRQNRVIFLSDGLATAGDTSQDHIMQMAKERVQRGIGLTTIGVGNEFDVALMRGLAEQGAGNFYFLEDATAATEVFTEELDFFMQPIALDVKLDAVAGPGYRFGEVVGSRLWAAQADYGAIQIPAVFVASRTTQSGGAGRRGGGSMIFIHMTSVTGNTGRVADLTLSFRAPGSEVRTQQVVSLDYANDPEVTPEQPYLSSPEMAERFAMYNMYLGIRAATQASDLGCARSVLEATRTAGKTWNATHEDPDLQADLTLVDQYLGNIAEKVGSGYDGTGRPISSCPTAIDPDQPPFVDPQPIDDYDDHPRYHGLACSTGSATGSLPIMLAAFVAAAGLRRRRRR